MSPGRQADSPANAAFLAAEIDWFLDVMRQRIRIHSGEDPPADLVSQIPPPGLTDTDDPGFVAGIVPDDSPYAAVLRKFSMSPAERLVLALAFIPHVRADLLDPFFIRNAVMERRFTEFGGASAVSHAGFLPTGETALFLLAGDNLSDRLRFRKLFDPDHFFYTSNILRVDHRQAEEPRLSGSLQVTPEYLELLTTGGTYSPPFGPEFPAQRITTRFDWEDLVLDPMTRQEVNDILTWARYETDLMVGWGLEKRLKPGFRSLFYGPPGTGKTLTASLVGKVLGRPVYRIDLSKVVSKWIGETEKNLASLFDQAQHQTWVLFFDEADALFSKRTDSRSANDRAANQQVSYLLQRIEDFPGLVILATNLRSNVDEAFARRFQSMIHFGMPGYEQRLRLWEDHFRNQAYALSPDVDLTKIAREHEISGGSIVNVLRYACLRAVVRDPQLILPQDLINGIRRESHKEV